MKTRAITGRRAYTLPGTLPPLAEVATEAILVETLAGRDVPQTAEVSGQISSPSRIVPSAVQVVLELEIRERQIARREEQQQRVDAEAGRDHRSSRPGVAMPEHDEDVPVVDHRITERVVLVVEFRIGLGRRSPSSRPSRVAEAAGNDVADDDLSGKMLSALDQHLALRGARRKCAHAGVLEQLEQGLGDRVVQHA
jgi:hypothetical protein